MVSSNMYTCLQVVPVVSTQPSNYTASNARQLATPSQWPLPGQQRGPSSFPQFALQNALYDSVGDPVTVIEGRRLLTDAADRLQRVGGYRRQLSQENSNVPMLPAGSQGAVFRPRPTFPGAPLSFPFASQDQF